MPKQVYLRRNREVGERVEYEIVRPHAIAGYDVRVGRLWKQTPRQWRWRMYSLTWYPEAYPTRKKALKRALLQINRVIEADLRRAMMRELERERLEAPR